MKSNINDVAKHAGVSIKTVSRVMNNEPSVRQTTRTKVMASVAELNYQPSSAARNLAATKSYNIAYIYDNPNAYYVIDMQNGILSQCRKQGFELLIHPCNAKDKGIVEQLITMTRHGQLAGVVLTPPFSEMPQLIAELHKHDVKFVRVLSGNKKPDDIAPCVMVDDHQAAFNITQHLIELGHRDIAFISGGKEHKSTFERLAGFKDALLEHGIKLHSEYVVDGEYSFDSGVQGAQKLLKLERQPSAIFSCNDEIAAGALFAARLLHIAIPERLSIVGFENSPFSRQTWPKLTTANQPNISIAQRAAELLIADIRGQLSENPQCVFTPELITRESSGDTNL